LKPDIEFDRQPILTGDSIELRPLRLGDFEALFEAASDPRIWVPLHRGAELDGRDRKVENNREQKNSLREET